MSKPELFVVLTRDGRAWASAEPVEGVFPHTVVHPIRPGEAVEEVPYEAWHTIIGETVDLETLRDDLRRGRLPEPVREAPANTTVGSDKALFRRRLAWIYVAIGVAAVVAGGGGFVAQARVFATYRAVDGLVIDTSVASDAVRNQTRYTPIVRYQYEVAGNRYEGSQFSWSSSSYGDSLDAVGMLAPYGPGQPVTVYVHPDDASRSFLRRDGAENLVWFSVFLLGLPVFAYRFLVARDYGT
jgi:Protein of unknown function (DUF3592)